MENNPVTIEEVSEIAPLLKPAPADVVINGIASRDTRLTVDDLEELLPFISDEVLSKMALKIASSPEWEDIRKIAYCLDHETLRKITDQFIDEGKQIDNLNLIQFLTDHDCAEIARKAYEKNGPQGIADFAPYLNSSFLMELAKKIAAKEGIREIALIAPFLDMQQFSEFIAEKYL